MAIHFILLIFSLILFVFAVDKNQFRGAIITSSILFFVTAFILVTFRAETVGNDTSAYIQFFRISGLYDSFDQLLNDTRFEPGYVLLNYIVSRFTNDYIIFFFVCNSIVFICTIYFFREYCLNKNVWPILWLIWGTFYWLFSVVRASMAVCLSYMFFDAVLKNKLPRALVWFVVASSFHYSTLVCGMVLFLRVPLLQKITKHKFILAIGFLVTGLFLGKLMSLLPAYYNDYYTDSMWAEGGVRLASIMDFVFLLITYIATTISNSKKVSLKYYYEFRNLFLLGLGFSFLGLFFNQFNRVEMFFIPLAIVYIVNSFRYISYFRKGMVIGIMVGVATYQIIAFIVRPEWLNLFPYYFR